MCQNRKKHHPAIPHQPLPLPRQRVLSHSWHDLSFVSPPHPDSAPLPSVSNIPSLPRTPLPFPLIISTDNLFNPLIKLVHLFVSTISLPSIISSPPFYRIEFALPFTFLSVRDSSTVIAIPYSMGSMAYPTFPLSYHTYAAASTSRYGSFTVIDRWSIDICSRSNIQKNTGKRERTTYTKHQLVYLEDEFTVSDCNQMKLVVFSQLNVFATYLIEKSMIDWRNWNQNFRKESIRRLRVERKSPAILG